MEPAGTDNAVSWLAILRLREMAEIIQLKARSRGRIGPRLSLFSIVFVSTFMLALVVAWYVASDATTTVATKITPNTIQVVDGDTIRTGSLVYRLVGFDTPPRCNTAPIAKGYSRASQPFLWRNSRFWRSSGRLGLLLWMFPHDLEAPAQA